MQKLDLTENLTIAHLQCFAWSKKAKLLKILSGNVILTSIKSLNSVTNFAKNDSQQSQPRSCQYK